ncbi:DUF2975 domain-containing protein [Shewanella sp.]|uniref:DUF2975 domain-containing protein n=1 Tax=Shewanella sp. TaxID=50422 RepID=UPI001ECCE658|nr:DUF2975 domain-containing protein [Shewanella sp.]NRB23144.1 DUF2975 domain-containing protein [Shewanella sp.]
MNVNMQKLMKISGFFRVLVLVVMAAVAIYLGYSYLVLDEIRFETSMQFLELWDHEGASQGVLLAIQSPSFITLFLGFYWLQRLLSHFQLGLFFGNEAMRCYLWLIWLKVLGMVLEIAQHLATGYYHKQFFENSHVEIRLDPGNLTTLLLMLLIVYLLKAAKEIEAENKEFI